MKTSVTFFRDGEATEPRGMLPGEGVEQAAEDDFIKYIDQMREKLIAGASWDAGKKENEIRNLIKMVFMEAQKGGGYTKETEDHFYNLFTNSKTP